MAESQSTVHCSFSIEMVESKPLIVCPPDFSSNNNCTLLLEPCTSSSFNQDYNLSHSIFGADFLKFGSHNHLQLENFNQPQVKNEESKRIIDLTGQSDHNDIEMTEKSATGNDVVEISDDDDVVFVGIIEKTKQYELQNFTDEHCKDKTIENVRRNPMRSARNKSRDLSKELIYEEDFAFLDTSDEEENEKENKDTEKKPPQQTSTLKEWPINVHERPEYNTETNKIEPFDYTIRDIQKKVPMKKNRLDIPPVKRKSKKKYCGNRSKRRRSPLSEEDRVTLEDLKDLVETTTNLLVEYLETSKKTKYESDTCSYSNKVTVLRTQVTLLSLVTNTDEEELLKKFTMPK